MQHQETRAVEFGTVDELLRHDRARHAPPPGLAARLGASLAREPSPVKPWWKRVLKW